MKTDEINIYNSNYYCNLNFLPSYTLEEIYAQIADHERQIAMGNYLTSEELFKTLDDEFHFLDEKKDNVVA
jgi:hypothetical protein